MTALLIILAVSGLPVFSVFIVAALLVAAGLLVLLVPALRRRTLLLTVLIVAAVSAAFFGLRLSIQQAGVDRYFDQTGTFTAQLTDAPVLNNGTYRYKAKLLDSEISNTSGGKTVYILTRQTLPALPYDTIRADGVFFAPTSYNKSRFLSDGVSLCAAITESKHTVEVTAPARRPVAYQLIRLREAIREAVRRYLPLDEGTVMTGLLLGDTSELPADIHTAFNVAGVIHILSVSGQHLGILLGILLALFNMMKLSKRLSAVLSMPAILFFSLLCGLTPSVVRAAITCLLYLLATILFRRQDALNSLFVAVLLMLAVNPFLVLDIGFLYSVFSVFGCILLSPHILRYLCRKTSRWPRLRYVHLMIAQTMAANLMIAPITILFFNQFSLAFPLGNLLIGPLVAPVFLLGMVGVCFAAVPVVAYPAMWLSGLCIKYMIGIARLVSAIPFAANSTGALYVTLWLGFVLLLVGASFLLRLDRPKARIAVLLSAVMLLFGIGSFTVTNAGVTVITVPNLSAGTAVIVQRDGLNILVGCGADRYAASGIVAAMGEIGITRLDVILIPAYHTDCAGGVAATLQRVKTNCLMLPAPQPGNTYYHQIAAASESIETVATDTGEIHAGEHLTLRVEPGGSVVMVGDRFSAIIPSMYAVADDRPFDLSIGTPGGLLATSGARTAIVSGQQTAHTIELLAARGVRAYTTAEIAYTVRQRGSRLWLYTVGRRYAM